VIKTVSKGAFFYYGFWKFLNLRRKMNKLPHNFLEMTNKTTEDYEQERNKQVANMRSMLDYVMGLLFIAIGAYILYKYGSDTTYLILGILFDLYGIWRIYKGFKKRVSGQP
jgi:hypothetical protein